LPNYCTHCFRNLHLPLADQPLLSQLSVNRNITATFDSMSLAINVMIFVGWRPSGTTSLHESWNDCAPSWIFLLCSAGLLPAGFQPQAASSRPAASRGFQPKAAAQQASRTPYVGQLFLTLSLLTVWLLQMEVAPRRCLCSCRRASPRAQPDWFPCQLVSGKAHLWALPIRGIPCRVF